MADDLQDGGLLPAGTAVRAGRPGGRPAGVRQLFGREAEVEALHGALAGLDTGAGRAIVLVGEPGIGKSALMRTAAAQARALGVPVLSAYGPDVTVPPLRGALPLGGGPEVSAHAASAPAVLVAVDDLHQLAAHRMSDVERLLEETAAAPVLCLMAYRQRQLAPALAAVLSRAVSAGLLEVWNLGPLSQEQARDLLDDDPGAEEMHREAEGNPQYLKVIAADGGKTVDAGLAILGELAALDPVALTVVQAAAVLGTPFLPELLAAVASLELPQTLDVLDTLAHLDLVRPAEPAPQLALRHRAVGMVVYQRLDPSRRSALHRRVETVLAGRAAPIAERAHHVARAADPGRPEHAATLIAAARDLLYGSPADAAGYLRVALTLLQEGEPHWHEAQVLLARTRLLTGDASESLALLDALRAAIPGGSSGDATALADSSRIERRLGRYTEAGAIARSGLEALADSDTATAAALHTELAEHAYDVHDFESTRLHAETAAAIARRHHDRVGEAFALAQAALGHLFTGDQGTAQARASRAAELVDAASDATLLTNLEASFQLGMAEGMLGRMGDAERHLARAAALSRRTGQTYIQPQILTVLANAHLRSGNLGQALATLDETALHVDRVGNPATRAIIANLSAETLFWRDGPGDASKAADWAEQAVTIADGAPTAWATAVRCFNAELALLTGDAARARWLLLDAAGGTGLSRITTWRKPRWCDTMAQAAVAEGDRPSVEHWAALAETCIEQLPSVGRVGFALRARMRAHAVNGDTEAAVRSGQDAAADFSRSGDRIEVCRTLLAAAALSLDAGRTDQVADWLDRVAVLADRIGSARLAEEVSRQRGRLNARGGTADAPDASDALAPLSAREREIAGLASTGMTSGEIAERLFLSVRTVDSHLGRIYRKLEVSNRAGLTRTMLRHGTPKAPQSAPTAG